MTDQLVYQNFNTFTKLIMWHESHVNRQAGWECKMWRHYCKITILHKIFSILPITIVGQATLLGFAFGGISLPTNYYANFLGILRKNPPRTNMIHQTFKKVPGGCLRDISRKNLSISIVLFMSELLQKCPLEPKTALSLVNFNSKQHARSIMLSILTLCPSYWQYYWTCAVVY